MLPPRGPQRPLAASVFVVTTGGGILLGSTTLYLTRIIGISAVRVGLGLTVGAVLGMVAGPLMGHVADRRGPREVQILTMLCGAVATAGYVVVRAFWTLVLVSLLTALIGAAASASRAPLVRALAGDRINWYLSYQRAITNVGVMVGIMIATIGIQLDTGPAYITLILLGAATFLGAAAMLFRLPHVPPIEASSTTGHWIALTDRPYLMVTLINGVMSVHLAIPVFALPLWIVNNTAAPPATITAVVVLNGLMIVALQVRMSRHVSDLRSAGQRMRWAGVAMLVSSALIGVTAGLSRWTAGLLLIAAMVAYTLGELWHTVASFELMFGLAVPHAQGQYAGVFGLGVGIANAAGPAVLAALCLVHGLPGWLALGGLLTGVGLLAPPAVRWAERNRFSATRAAATA
ncbi:MAG: MFS transporter [Micromonosporaceae bacterium]